MVAILPEEVLQKAEAQAPCRKSQLRQLALYYNHNLPSPPVLVACGPENTGKLKTIVALLSATTIGHAVVKSKECLSQRHLLTKIFSTCLRQFDQLEDFDKYDRTDSINSLVVNLQRHFESRVEKFVLVIDGIDKQKGASHTLLPALAKLADLVPNLSLILTSSSSRSISLHHSGIPFLYFPPYSRTDAITLVTRQPPSLPSDLPDNCVNVPEVQLIPIHRAFVTTIYDTLTTHTSSTSVQAFQNTCENLWPRFIWPMLSGEAPANKNVLTPSSKIQWDFARLLARNRSLFQHDGERAFLPQLTSIPTDVWSFEQLIARHQNTKQPQQSGKRFEPKQETPLLKLFSALLLVSSYLASHTPPKHDIILFSRLSSSSTGKRKYLSSALSKSRSGGVRKTPTKKKAPSPGELGNETPSKKRNIGVEGGEGLAGDKTPKSTRLLLEKTSNIPKPFTLERVIAILRTIHPDGLPRTKGTADKTYTEMAELERLRLVLRCSGSGADGGRGGDDAILEEKWRINIGRDFVSGIGQYWGMGLEGWEID